MENFNDKIRILVQSNLNETRINAKNDSFWSSLRKTGTTLWLDTGDMQEAELNWTSEMSALTTNNTLLNNEIQKGIYDSFIEETNKILKDLPVEKRIKEIAFVLNARHGLRLATRFGGLVSVELHTETAHDIEAIVNYGKRFHEICPDQFIVKVPYTPEGFIGAKKLKDAGVKINFTLEFSARQNVLVTMISRPDYVNVFLGRVGGFMADNKLGDGTGAGEMAVLSSQKWVTRLSANNPWPTKLIAASLRNYGQLEILAGTDVFTMPPKVAAGGHLNLKGEFTSRLKENYLVSIFDSGRNASIGKFWEVDDKVVELGKRLALKVPVSGVEFIERSHKAGCGDMFPVLSEDELTHIAKDGKIPLYPRWEKMIKDGKIAPDTLLTLAGLASFTTDQNQLDNRIKSIIG